MSRNPQNKNIPQALLYHFGEKRVGADNASTSLDAEVRKEGVKHLGKKAAIIGGAVVLAAGGYKLLEYSFDNSPTVRYQRELQEQQEEQQGAAPITVDQLDSDPTQVTVHVMTGAEVGNAINEIVPIAANDASHLSEPRTDTRKPQA